MILSIDFRLNKTDGQGMVVLGEAGKNESGKRLLRVICACGKENISVAAEVVSGRASHCKSCSTRPKDESVVGKKFGLWAVISEAGIDTNKKRNVVVRCQCGAEHTVPVANLKSKVSSRCRSCALKGTHNRRTHGEALQKPAEYLAWRGMKQRCYRRIDKSYKNYGGRGILVCHRWLGPSGYQNFLVDMGRRPGPGYSIERKKNNLGYSPGNCVWATSSEQSNNKRTTIRIMIGGVTRSLAEWCQIHEVDYYVAYARLKRGWDPKRAVTEEVRS